MEIIRIFNNNVVMARENGREVILTGRGVGFQAKPGYPVDGAKVARRFVPEGEQDLDELARLLATIAPEYLQLITDALAECGFEDLAVNSPSLVIALADHIGFAVGRQAKNLTIEYPLVAEVKNLYPEEFVRAGNILGAVNRGLAKPLPAAEQVAIALHLVNAGFITGNLSPTYMMTGVIQQMVTVLESSYGIQLDGASPSLGRFITHMRYLFVRIHSHSQLVDEPSSIGDAIRGAYPDAYKCAKRMAQIVELRMNSRLTEDEIAYLTLHVARVADSRA